jgi:hypothetical protein
MEQIRIRKVGGSLYCRLPPSFTRKYGLDQGDQLFWVTDETGARIKAVKVEKPDMSEAEFQEAS